ncbi:TRAP transporter substrate-binding protein [Sphaerochaeta sp. PS]|uniref:TRAP transporter substrate-binding protein n=1 Tax=Sphaerochaeta sp. PS TaxID=3076336 RepID=UPI0028A30E26|nr:TRAP transporter substrate-binding protein [Sphaerochaeta sp. PS]MDT4763047.1 TRAP transporter substrate-binding protein [Sphaerochaeta sp. PS]
MKKTIVVLMVVLLVSVGLFASGAKETSSANAKGQYVIKMATPSNPEDNCVKAFYYFEKIVEERTDGRIDVQVFDSGQLGGHRDYIEQMQMGSLQAAEINTAVLSGFDSKFMVFDLPYLSRNVKHLQSVLEGGLDEELSKSLEASNGLKVIGWMIRSPRNIYNSRNAIKTADDFKGMKIRVMESPIMTKTFQLLGAVPVPLSANERYMALQTGVVHGAENSVGIIVSQKEYEVTKYVSLTAHNITPNIIAFDKKYFDKLPADLQEVILKAGKEAGAYATKLDSDSESATLEQLRGFGMQVNDIADKSSFIEKVSPIYEQYRAEIGGDIIDAFLK